MTQINQYNFIIHQIASTYMSGTFMARAAESSGWDRQVPGAPWAEDQCGGRKGVSKGEGKAREDEEWRQI